MSDSDDDDIESEKEELILEESLLDPETGGTNKKTKSALLMTKFLGRMARHQNFRHHLIMLLVMKHCGSNQVSL